MIDYVAFLSFLLYFCMNVKVTMLDSLQSFRHFSVMQFRTNIN